MSACEVDEAMSRLFQVLLKGCWSGVCKLAHDSHYHVRREFPDPQGSSSSIHSHNVCLSQTSSTLIALHGYECKSNLQIMLSHPPVFWEGALHPGHVLARVFRYRVVASSWTRWAASRSADLSRHEMPGCISVSHVIQVW